MKAGMFPEPLSDDGMLVRPVVVADQVDLATLVPAIDRLEEVEKLDMRVPRIAATVDAAAGHLQRCEETGGAVPLVVVRHPGRQPGPHRQDRLGPVERLDLRLLVHAQHQGPFGRVDVQADEVGHLGVELRVLAELEGLDPMRLQAVFLPDAVHGGTADAEFLGQTTRAPMGGGLRLPHRRGDDGALLLGVDRLRAPAARLGLQAGEPLLAVSTTPRARRIGRDVQSPRHLAHAFALGTRQDDPGTQPPGLGQGLGPSPGLEEGSITSADHERFGHVHHAAATHGPRCVTDISGTERQRSFLHEHLAVIADDGVR
jgi:hypothetical protein